MKNNQFKQIELYKKKWENFNIILKLEIINKLENNLIIKNSLKKYIILSMLKILVNSILLLKLLQEKSYFIMLLVIKMYQQIY